MEDLTKIDSKTAVFTVKVEQTITMQDAEAELAYAQADLERANARIAAAQTVIDNLIAIGLEPTETPE